MRRSLRRQFFFLRAYAVLSSLVLVVLCTAAFTQSTQKFGHISVERLDVVDADGTLRMVISNKDRQHPGIIEGRTIDRPRPFAGMLFFNEAGDEVGGLTFTGREVNGQRRANAGLMFDQHRQDQTIGISYSESGGRRSAGLQVWDRAETGLGTLVDALNAANKLTGAERDKAIAAARAAAPPGPRRLFVGKNTDKAAIVSLADADGKPRLNITVDATGNPRIEFLDASGKVIAKLPQ
ncbi:MAG: hypothetical protein WD690_07455 [Vicinamibacterales bacterium]